METLASVWACDPRDLIDLGETRSPSVWESQCVFNSSPPAGLMWTEQLSPHLQRNQQLQDTLLQREEELARLQDENSKLREFFNSAFVRNLEEKAKKLTADGRRKLKRSLMFMDSGPLQNCSHHLQTSQQLSKRVCRNLTAEFCSESSETSSSSEPNLDLWVLRTLGLKDRDTIDTSTSSSSSLTGLSLSSSAYDSAVSLSSSSERTLNSSFSPVATSTPSSVHSQHEFRFNPAESHQNLTTSSGQHSDFTASGLTKQSEIRSYNTLPVFQSPEDEPAFTQSPDRAETGPTRPVSRVQTLDGNQEKLSVYWTPPKDKVQLSPRGERVLISPTSSSSPVMNRIWTPDCNTMSPSVGPRPPATPQTPRSRTDLAFSMSLSPSSSVKTHSFPQGQAFVRKDPEGRWNFTWVPRQGP
ncbi:geminin coiled-coil domain-containing protein 1 [Acanthopagrus latus]|uniref:geminin coiled-coil domain-containing protein 1 n=1 Tax=Acanthopagrus latus TaxID=8177 RepID=UPI00187C24EA|nr:geminin coiled-coil domain-containing protein 1 [Acanthopagrus latus]